MRTPIEVATMLELKLRSWSTKRIARELNIDRKTVRRYVRSGGWIPYGSRNCGLDLHGPESKMIRAEGDVEMASANAAGKLPPQAGNRTFTRLRQAKIKAQMQWMHDATQALLAPDQVKCDVDGIDEIDKLLRKIREGGLSDRNKSIAVLASRRRISSRVACLFLGISRTSFRKYVRTFEHGGTAALFSRQVRRTRMSDNETIKQAIFTLLHEPPNSYGINRTTWKMEDLVRVLRSRDCSVCPQIIRQITKDAGYRWRKARTVLTSKDPNYSQKLTRIHSILSQLSRDEAFFSIDEFGPFAVKFTGGRSLVACGEQRMAPQWQRSKGSLILTAALELSTNQVSYFYSTAKNTSEMIRMMDVLLNQHANHRKLYLSWDAASWHISTRLWERIEQHNRTAASECLPLVETAALPIGAQFVNVIESVFSGMARAIIHNSDYGSVSEAKAAIDRYYEERNLYFQQNPRRAGKKIWGKERELAVFDDANNCKDPYYR
jgi:transposase